VCPSEDIKILIFDVGPKSTLAVFKASQSPTYILCRVGATFAQEDEFGHEFQK